jgi:hypothetical protein
MQKIKDPVDLVVPLIIVIFLFMFVLNGPQCLKN